eukprot:9221631-Karenia_brevis.AAC.1
MQTLVKSLTGKSNSEDAEASDTIDSVRGMLLDKGSILPDQQRLIFVGTEIEDVWSLWEYFIQKVSTLHLVLHLRGNMYFNVNISDQQRLICVGNELEDGCTLLEYDIQKQSTLHFVLRLRGDKLFAANTLMSKPLTLEGDAAPMHPEPPA